MKVPIYMEKQNWINIINHQAKISCEERGLLFNSITLKEQYQLLYQIALDLLCETGE